MSKYNTKQENSYTLVTSYCLLNLRKISITVVNHWVYKQFCNILYLNHNINFESVKKLNVVVMWLPQADGRMYGQGNTVNAMM